MSEQAVPASSGQAAGGPTPDAIMQLGLGFWGSKTLLSAVELGLFSELASAGALDADALRERLGLHPLAVKVRALANKNRGMDTFRAVEALGLDPDVRDYSIVAPMLRALGVTSVRLLTGNPGEGACHREMRHRGSGSLTLDGRHVPRGSAGQCHGPLRNGLSDTAADAFRLRHSGCRGQRQHGVQVRLPTKK